jgi:hypothetical protein
VIKPEIAAQCRSGFSSAAGVTERYELGKEQKRVAELEGTVARLAAAVKEQAAQIQKVSAQLDVNKPAAQVASNKQ